MRKYYVNYDLGTATTKAYEADSYEVVDDFVNFYRGEEMRENIVAAVKKDQVFTITREDGLTTT